MDGPNLSGRAGRWSSRHWKLALTGWLGFAIVAVLVGNAVGHVQMKDSDFASGEAATALRMLSSGGLVQPATENVLIQSKRYTADDPEFGALIAMTSATLAPQPNVTNLQDPMFKQGNGGRVSQDGHSALITFDI